MKLAFVYVWLPPGSSFEREREGFMFIQTEERYVSDWKRSTAPVIIFCPSTTDPKSQILTRLPLTAPTMTMHHEEQSTRSTQMKTITSSLHRSPLQFQSILSSHQTPQSKANHLHIKKTTSQSLFGSEPGRHDFASVQTASFDHHCLS